MTDRELLDRKGHEVNDDLPPLPEPEFSSWHGEDCKTLLNPTGVCNAFPWPPRVPEKPYWVDKGYHGEPLFTAGQMRAYARAAVLAERERWAKECESDPDAVFAAIWNSLVIPGEYDAMDDTDKNRWRGVIMQAIGFTAELKAAAIRGVKT